MQWDRLTGIVKGTKEKVHFATSLVRDLGLLKIRVVGVTVQEVSVGSIKVKEGEGTGNPVDRNALEDLLTPIHSVYEGGPLIVDGNSGTPNTSNG